MSEEGIGQEERTLQYMQDYYQNQYMVLQQSMENASHALSEMRETLEAINNAQMISGKEMLSSIGAGMLVKTNTGETDSIMTEVGGGFYIEKDIEEAKLYISKSIASQENLIKKLSEGIERVKRAIIDTAAKLDNL